MNTPNPEEWTQLEQMYLVVKPLVEKMKAKYPTDLNIDGLEPALTSDIAEIALQIRTRINNEWREKILGMKRDESQFCSDDMNLTDALCCAGDQARNAALDDLLEDKNN